MKLHTLLIAVWFFILAPPPSFGSADRNQVHLGPGKASENTCPTTNLYRDLCLSGAPFTALGIPHSCAIHHAHAQR